MVIPKLCKLYLPLEVPNGDSGTIWVSPFRRQQPNICHVVLPNLAVRSPAGLDR